MPGFKSVFVSSLTEVTTVAKDQLGDIRWEGNKVYKYVQYRATAIACIAGRMMGFFALDGHKLHQVTMDSSDEAAGTIRVGAGVSVGIIPTNGFGWVQIKGNVKMTLAAVAGTDGDPMTLVGGTADTGNLDLYITTVASSHKCAHAGDISDNEFILDCPF